MSREQIVRDTAYAIWEAEGKPHGRAAQHWKQAEDRVAASLTGGAKAAAPATAKSASLEAKPPAKAAATKAAAAAATAPARTAPAAKPAAPKKQS